MVQIPTRCSLRKGTGAPGTCVWCGKRLVGRQRRWCGSDCPLVWLRNHTWTDARAYAVLLNGYPNRCVTCGEMTIAPEVNHIRPRAGRGYGPGCHHHQSNLQVLCHTCHVAVTNRQRAARAARKLARARKVLASTKKPSRRASR